MNKLVKKESINEAWFRKVFAEKKAEKIGLSGCHDPESFNLGFAMERIREKMDVDEFDWFRSSVIQAREISGRPINQLNRNCFFVNPELDSLEMFRVEIGDKFHDFSEYGNFLYLIKIVGNQVVLLLAEQYIDDREMEIHHNIDIVDVADCDGVFGEIFKEHTLADDLCNYFARNRREHVDRVKKIMRNKNTKPHGGPRSRLERRACFDSAYFATEMPGFEFTSKRFLFVYDYLFFKVKIDGEEKEKMLAFQYYEYPDGYVSHYYLGVFDIPQTFKFK